MFILLPVHNEYHQHVLTLATLSRCPKSCSNACASNTAGHRHCSTVAKSITCFNSTTSSVAMSVSGLCILGTTRASTVVSQRSCFNGQRKRRPRPLPKERTLVSWLKKNVGNRTCSTQTKNRHKTKNRHITKNINILDNNGPFANPVRTAKRR